MLKLVITIFNTATMIFFTILIIDQPPRDAVEYAITATAYGLPSLNLFYIFQANSNDDLLSLWVRIKKAELKMRLASLEQTDRNT